MNGETSQYTPRKEPRLTVSTRLKAGLPPARRTNSRWRGAAAGRHARPPELTCCRAANCRKAGTLICSARLRVRASGPTAIGSPAAISAAAAQHTDVCRLPVKFHKPLRVGDIMSASRPSVIRAETGRTGSFTLVTVVHEMSAGSGIAVNEEQDLVYRAAVGSLEAKPAAADKTQALKEREPSGWSVPWDPDAVVLFRYSALTYNAHRIHYDLPYAREKEGYPALVVNGGLTALMLVETAKPYLRRAITGYAARAMAPMFVGQNLALNGRLKGDVAELWASGPDGSPTYRVNVTTEK